MFNAQTMMLIDLAQFFNFRNPSPAEINNGDITMEKMVRNPLNSPHTGVDAMVCGLPYPSLPIMPANPPKAIRNPIAIAKLRIPSAIIRMPIFLM